MTALERRDLLAMLQHLTEHSTDHRLARTAEHLHRTCEQIDLACREDSTDDTITRNALNRTRIDVYQNARSAIYALQAQHERRAPQTATSAPAQSAKVRP